MFLLGLTGSIGMGKSTTTRMFADEGCAVWDADAAVHRLYGRGGAAVPLFAEAFPEAIEDGAVSRPMLKTIIAQDRDALKRIEQIVHPLVAQDRQSFLDNVTSDIAVLDIPLLFETGGDARLDAVVCVTVPPDVQRARVLARGTMTADQLDMILAKQLPNDEKCARADFVIETNDLETARAQVRRVVTEIRNRQHNA